MASRTPGPAHLALPLTRGFRTSRYKRDIGPPFGVLPLGLGSLQLVSRASDPWIYPENPTKKSSSSFVLIGSSSEANQVRAVVRFGSPVKSLTLSLLAAVVGRLRINYSVGDVHSVTHWCGKVARASCAVCEIPVPNGVGVEEAFGVVVEESACCSTCYFRW